MEREDRLRILSAKNPFVSSSAGDPWDSAYPDVESINLEPYQGLQALLREKADNPALNCAGLVLGEVGSGKTHLISRLLELGRQGEDLFVFAYVQPIEDPEQTFRYLLREIVLNLCRPLDQENRLSALDLLLCRILTLDAIPELASSEKSKGVLKRLRESPARLFSLSRERLRTLEHKGVAFLRRFFQNMPKEMARVLFACLDPDRRPVALSWLKGTALDEEDAALLGVAGRSDKSPAALEQEARDVLFCLGDLLARYRIPLLVCFDRLENLETREQISSLGRMLEFLVDSVKSVLPVVFVRWMQWEENFRQSLNQHVVSRLEANTFELLPCTPDQAVALVRERLRHAFGESELEDLYPFRESEMRELFSVGLSPREVIIQANQKLKSILREAPPEAESAEEKLRRAFKQQRREVERQMDRYPPDRGRMRKALELYLGSSAPSGVAAEEVVKPKKTEKYADLRVRLRAEENGEEREGLVIIDTELHHASVRAALKGGIQHLENNPRGFALYIRDTRCPFPEPPKWRATNEMLGAFRNKGGQTLFLEPEEAAEWYALALLSYAVKEGDVSVQDGDDRSRSISLQEMASSLQDSLQVRGFDRLLFRLRNIAGREKDGEAAAEKGVGGIAETRKVAEASLRYLRECSMLMAQLGDLSEHMQARGTDIGERQLLQSLSGYSDRFELIPVQDGTMVKAKREWLHAQGERI